MTEAALVDTVLFDFGGVVITTPFELHDHSWRGPFDPGGDDLWRAAMAGDITERSYWHQRTQPLYPDAENPTFAYMRDLYEQDESAVVRPEIVDLLDELVGHGLRVAALTNDLTKFHPADWVQRMTVIGRFDPLIDLSHVGFLKPDPRAYGHALKALDRDASAVVFLDDQPGNVDGARAAGITAVWFDPTDVAGSLARLRDRLPL